MILRLLPDEEVVKCGAVSRNFYNITRSDAFWGLSSSYVKMLQEHDAQHFAECNEKVVTVLFDYDEEEADLQLVEGEEILVLEEDISGWWRGEPKGGGQIGIFPSNFTDITNFGTIFVEKYHYTLRHLLIGGAKKKEGAEKKKEAEKKTAKEAEKKKEEFRQKEEEKGS
jgi:hypothetical protein